MAEGIVKLMLLLARIVCVLLGGVAGYQIGRFSLLQGWWPWTLFPYILAPYFIGIFFFALLGYLVTPVFVRTLGFIGLSFEKNLESLSWNDISVAL
ncbi:MAG TPA: twitching motility protein PilT, partial [Synergistales bacterium]|nr:twitching motility protein PilT [Synergistales bacterium]